MSVNRCGTRQWKEASARREGRAIRRPGTALAEPVFQGRVYVADLHVDGPSGSISMPEADMATVLAYLEKAIPPIVSYTGQYGPVRISVGRALVPFQLKLDRTVYSDADVQGWVNAIASSLPADPAPAIFLVNPPGLTNTDAKESGGVGVLGYHGKANAPYCFINALGTGFTLDDGADRYAEAASHEVAEMAVDPSADDRNPEVCDGCGTNCLGAAAYRSYFDASGRYLGSGTTFPPRFPYGYFVSAIAKPAAATDCPAGASSCAYGPP